MRARLQDWLTVAVLICSCELFVGILPAQQKAAAPQGIDALTAPIALYPDALIAQVLDASTNPAEVQDFSNWLKQNASLKGSELQEAASKANFDAAFIALSLFPDVIQMMAQKLDWTKQLGEAFKADAQGVSKSIQRLRQQAQAMGNLKTNEQQQVVTQKSSSGDQVIVIQPANPQVVYVPQYNPQVVYVQPAPPPPPPSSRCRRRGADWFHRRDHRWGSRAITTTITMTGLTHGIARRGRLRMPTTPRRCRTNDITTQRPCSNSDTTTPATCRISGRPITSRTPPNANRRHRRIRRSGRALRRARNRSRPPIRRNGRALRRARNRKPPRIRRSGRARRRARNRRQTRIGRKRQSAATSSSASGQSASQRSGRAAAGYESGSAARQESQRGNRSTGSEKSGGGARRR